MNEVSGVLDRFPSLVISFGIRNFVGGADFGSIFAGLLSFLIKADLYRDLVGEWAD